MHKNVCAAQVAQTMLITGDKVNKFRHIKSIYLTGRVNKYIII